MSWILNVIKDGIIRQKYNFTTEQACIEQQASLETYLNGVIYEIFNDNSINDSPPASISSTYSSEKIEEKIDDIITQSSEILDADGALADVTIKVNSIIAALKATGILE